MGRVYSGIFSIARYLCSVAMIWTVCQIGWMTVSRYALLTSGMEESVVYDVDDNIIKEGRRCDKLVTLKKSVFMHPSNDVIRARIVAQSFPSMSAGFCRNPPSLREDSKIPVACTATGMGMMYIRSELTIRQECFRRQRQLLSLLYKPLFPRCC